MKFPSWVFAFLLTGCTDEIIRMMDKKDAPPPFSEVIKNVKVDMNLEEVKKVLAGNLPNLKFTSTDASHSWWEFKKRETVDPSSETSPIEERTTILDFDNQGKLHSVHTFSCLFPDQEPPPEEEQGAKCYKEHIFPVGRELISKALIRFMMESNFQIGNSERAAALEIISAHGTQSIKGAKEKVYVSLTSTIEESQKDSTQVFISASYVISEKQGAVGQIGAIGITIPIPLPFNKKEETVDSGNVSPKYFLTFYDKFSRMLAERYLVYKEPKIAPPAPVVVDKPTEPTEVEKAPLLVEPLSFGTAAIDSELNLKKGPADAPNLGNVPIDSESNLKKEHPKKPEAQPVVENVPIDSEQNLRKSTPKVGKPEDVPTPRPSNAPIDSGLESTPPKKR